jgi:hypothetical protein
MGRKVRHNYRRHTFYPVWADNSNSTGNNPDFPDNHTFDIYTTAVQVKQVAAVSLTSAPNPSHYGQSATLTAIVTPTPPGSGTPTGSVTFMDGTTILGTSSLSAGTAAWSTSILSVGTHALTAVYSGDATFASGASAPVTQTVYLGQTWTTVSSNHNPSTSGGVVIFTATVSAMGGGTATGTVTFMDGTTTLGTATLNAVAGMDQATFTTSTLTVGSHSITAVYGGDSRFMGSTSPVLTQTVQGGMGPSSAPSLAGRTANSGSVPFDPSGVAGITTQTGMATPLDPSLWSLPDLWAPSDDSPAPDQAAAFALAIPLDISALDAYYGVLSEAEALSQPSVLLPA